MSQERIQEKKTQDTPEEKRIQKLLIRYLDPNISENERQRVIKEIKEVNEEFLKGLEL